MCSTTVAMPSADHFFCFHVSQTASLLKFLHRSAYSHCHTRSPFLYPGYLRKRPGILAFFTVFDKKVVICHLSLQIFAIVCTLNRCLWSFLLPIFQYCSKTDLLSSSQINAVHFRGHAESHGGAKDRALQLLPFSDT